MENLQHHDWEHALQSISEAIELACNRRCTLGSVLEGVRDCTCYTDDRKQCQTDFGAPHEITEEADLQGGLHGDLSCRVELVQEEERAEAFDGGNRCEVAHMQMVNEGLKRLGLSQDVPDPCGKYGHAEATDSHHQQPEQRHEDDAGAISENPSQDHVAVEREPGFLDLIPKTCQ